jgi:hypothetical protein
MTATNPDLIAAIDQLISTCQNIATESEFSFAPADRGELDAVMQRLPLSSDLVQWYMYKAPQTFWFWFGNQLYLYDPHTLRSMQVGYRWDEDETEFDEGEWSPNWVVIGDLGADPIIAHIDEPGTPISMDMHGNGEWSPTIIAPDLQSFLMGLSIWLDVFLIRWEGEYEDEDCGILPEVLEEFNREIRTVLAEEYAQYWPWGG